MDWTVRPYNKANHPPKVVLNHPNELKVKSGDKVTLSAEGSTDPDGNKLSYEWIYYREPGSFESKDLIKVQDHKSQIASFVAPEVTQPETLHIILAVTDNGVPALTRYQRVIVVVAPKLAEVVAKP
jgi:hypothetical protein